MRFHRALTAVRTNEAVISSVFAHRTRKANTNHRQNTEPSPYRSANEYHTRDESHTRHRNQYDGGNSQASELLEISFHNQQFPFPSRRPFNPGNFFKSRAAGWRFDNAATLLRSNSFLR